MSLSPEYRKGLIGAGTGLVSGILFSFLVGSFDPARYLIEQTTLIPFEALFVAISVVAARKYGMIAGLCYFLFGLGGAIIFLYPDISITSAVFGKTAVTGLMIALSDRFGRSFTEKLAAISAPGIIMAALIGIPLVYNGVSPETLEEIRREAMDMYLVFMTPGDAKNAADNAMGLITGMFGIGFAVLAIGTIATAWIACLLSAWVIGRSGDDFMKVPTISRFTLPFPVIWLFLASFAVVLAEVKTIYPAALNLLVITAFLYGIQGVAVIVHHMNRAALGRVPRVLFWLIFFITLAFSGIIFVFTGIIDNWFHLRSAPSAPGAAGGNEGTDHEGDSSRRR